MRAVYLYAARQGMRACNNNSMHNPIIKCKSVKERAREQNVGREEIVESVGEEDERVVEKEQRLESRQDNRMHVVDPSVPEYTLEPEDGLLSFPVTIQLITLV